MSATCETCKWMETRSERNSPYRDAYPMICRFFDASLDPSWKRGGGVNGRLLAPGDSCDKHEARDAVVPA